VRAKKPFTFGVKGAVEGEPEPTRGHRLDVSFPEGPRAVLPAKVKENLKIKGAWIVEALLPADGDYTLVVKVDNKEISGSPFSVKAEYVSPLLRTASRRVALHLICQAPLTRCPQLQCGLVQSNSFGACKRSLFQRCI
jgi:hypothetical protein